MNKTYGLMTPSDIYSYLDRYISGQDDVKDTVSKVLFLHLLKKTATKYLGMDTKKSNMLLIGPTASGKTLLMQKIEQLGYFKVFKMPATDITNTGYVGTSVEDHFAGFLDSATPDEVENSIVFIDEFDKICTSVGSDTSTASFNRQKQNKLLTILEGSDLRIETGSGMTKVSTTLSTKNILFVLCGNFEGMRKRRAEEDKPKGIGFNLTKEGKKDIPLHKELQMHEVIPEIAGRITAVAELKELTREQLIDVFKNKEDSVYLQYQVLLQTFGLTLELDDEHIEKIVDRCIKNEVGARGLHTELEAYVSDTLLTGDLDFTKDKHKSIRLEFLRDRAGYRS